MAQPLSGRRFGDHSWDIESSPGDVKRTLSAPMKKNEKNPGTLFGSVMLWYSSALVTITTSKMILYRLPFPYVVCYFQFGIAALCCEYSPRFTASALCGPHELCGQFLRMCSPWIAANAPDPNPDP
mgnify:CR=1 FL=1